MSSQSEYYALITGASRGLGRAFAEELARRGHSLLLVSLPGTGLPELSGMLGGQYGVSVHIVEADLLPKDAVEKIAEYVNENNLRIDILINNAGVGHGGGIGDYTDSTIEESIFLNIMCTTMMTNAFARELKGEERAYILNIGSFGGFMPVAYKSVYSATKSYVYHFSLAIRRELFGSGVSVSVAMPGPVMTNNRVRERINKMGFIARSNSMEPDKAATYIIDNMFRCRSVIIPGRLMRLIFYIGTILPFRLLMTVTGKLFRGVN